MSGKEWRVNSSEIARNLNEFILGMLLAGKHCTVKVTEGLRSLNQNDMEHAVYAAVAAQKGDETPLDIKRMCKLHFGVPILRAENDTFRRFYDVAIKPNLSYEQKLEAMDSIAVTSIMSSKQASAYIDAMLDHWTREGFGVADPRMGK